MKIIAKDHFLRSLAFLAIVESVFIRGKVLENA